MFVKISEIERKKRLSEMSSCNFCSNQYNVWRSLPNRQIRKRTKTGCCSAICSRRILAKNRPQPGQRYGRWIVISINTESQRTRWVCKCDCGNKKLVYQMSLTCGDSTSCGCGASQHRSKRLSSDIIQQRLNQTKPCLNCDAPVHTWEWIEKTTLRRKQNVRFCCHSCAGQYYGSDRTWFNISPAPRRMILAFGETKSVVEWSRDSRCVVSCVVLRGRISNGWFLEKAIVTPLTRQSGMSKTKSRIQAKRLMQDVVSGLAALAS